MLSLDIQKSKFFAQDFEKKHIQSLKDARDEVIHNGTLEVSTYPNLISKKIILQLEHEKDRRTKRRR